MAAPLIPPNWQLPDALRQRLGTNVGKQRVMQEDGHLLIIAHQVPAPGETTRRGVLFWYDADKQWHASTGDPGKLAIQMLLDSYHKQLQGYDTREAKAVLAQDYLPLLEGLAPVVRSSRNLYEVLQQARKGSGEVRELIDSRDQAYEISRNAEMLYLDAKHSLDIAVMRQAEEQAATSRKMSGAAHRLNLMAAVFFPLATLGAAFGTTLTDNWSWADSTLPFLTFLVVGLVSGLWLAIFINRPIR